MLTKTKFFTTGIHCQSCKTLIETEIDVLPGVKTVKVNYKSGETNLEYDKDKISFEKIKKEIKKLNYDISEFVPSSETSNKNSVKQYENNTKKYLLLFVLPPILIVTYYLINKLGLMEIMARLNDDHVSIFLIFIIGFLASFHCVGMCGGLVISYSANNLRNKNIDKSKSLPHLQYNLGRLISYTILGAVLGGFGSFFAINPSFTGFMLIFAGVFMVLLGLSLLTNFKILEAIKLKTPDFIARFLYNNKHKQKPKGPFIIGLLTAFMPCGPLQAMQLFALATGSIINGALTMAMYALGTIPVLFGFGHIISMMKQTKIKQMIKISGGIVIILGIVMLNRGLINFNMDISSLIPQSTLGQTNEPEAYSNEYQIINMDLNYNGYNPNILYIKAGVPVKWVINVKQMTACTNAIMIESLGIKRDLRIGENIITFTLPKNVEEIKFSCWMRMVWGKFIVTKNATPTSINNKLKTPIAQANNTYDSNSSYAGTCDTSNCVYKTK